MTKLVFESLPLHFLYCIDLIFQKLNSEEGYSFERGIMRIDADAAPFFTFVKWNNNGGSNSNFPVKLDFHLLEITTKDGALLFFSYDTLVAAASYKNVYVINDKSCTTSKHITNWYERNSLCAAPEVVTQEQLNETFN